MVEQKCATASPYPVPLTNGIGKARLSNMVEQKCTTASPYPVPLTIGLSKATLSNMVEQKCTTASPYPVPLTNGLNKATLYHLPPLSYFREVLSTSFDSYSAAILSTPPCVVLLCGPPSLSLKTSTRLQLINFQFISTS